MLLQAKADVESKDQGGRTPLSSAAIGGHLGAVKLVVEFQVKQCYFSDSVNRRFSFAGNADSFWLAREGSN